MSSTLSLNTTLEHIADRIKDPFLGAYSFFLVTLNWKIFIYVFSDIDHEIKIKEISDGLSFNKYQSLWGPLVVTMVFFIFSPILRTLVRFILQSLQRLDDYISRIPMDKEKKELIEKNASLVFENAKLSSKVGELVRARSYVHYFLAQNEGHKTIIANLVNKLPDINDQNVKNFNHHAHELAKGYQTLKDNDDKQSIKLD